MRISAGGSRYSPWPAGALVKTVTERGLSYPKEAGYMVGYTSPAQFSREYKRHFGYSPRRFRQQSEGR